MFIFSVKIKIYMGLPKWKRLCVRVAMVATFCVELCVVDPGVAVGATCRLADINLRAITAAWQLILIIFG